MLEEVQRRLRSEDRFKGATEIDVVAVRVNAYGEGEYEVRFSYPPDYEVAKNPKFLALLKRDIEETLPRAWVVAFAVSSNRDETRRVSVTFDYAPQPALSPS